MANRCTGEFVPTWSEQHSFKKAQTKLGHEIGWAREYQYYFCSNCEQRWIRTLFAGNPETAFEEMSLTELVRRERAGTLHRLTRMERVS